MHADDRLTIAVRCMAGLAQPCGPGELGTALGLGHSAQASLVRDLRAAGLVDGDKRHIRITSAGWARITIADGQGCGSVLAAALAGWPYAHRALIELLCSAVVARHHLADERTYGHLGFMLIGETDTGKTAAVRLICHMFGLPFEAVRRFLYSETPGSLFGRRVQVSSGSWQLVPSTAASSALLLLDEFDKADEPMRRAAWALFQGETTAMHEGEAWPLRPVPVLAANPGPADRYGLLRPEYRRRSVVLDTGYTRGRAAIFEELMTAGHHATASPGALPLTALRPPAARLNDRGLEVLRSVRDMLTAAGAEEFPGMAALELAALGRLALTGGDDHALAAYATGVCYLQVTATVPGQVIDGWEADAATIRGWFGEAGASLADAIERGRAGRELARRTLGTATVERARLSDELTVSIGALGERLRLAATHLQPRRLVGFTDEQKAEAAGVKSGLDKLRSQAAAVRSEESLAAMTARSAPWLTAAAEMTQRVAALAAQAERDRQVTATARRLETAERNSERAQRTAAERGAREAARQRTAALGAALVQVRAKARPLESDYRRGQRSDERISAARRSFRAWSDDDARAKRRMIEIDGLLRELHRQEDELVTLLGRRPRQNRLTLAAQEPSARHDRPQRSRRPGRGRGQTITADAAAPARVSPVRAQLGGYRG
jgi:hypothetical protein